MRAWLCLLAIGLLAGCHHPPPITFDEDKGTVNPVVQDIPGNNIQNENKSGDSELH